MKYIKIHINILYSTVTNCQATVAVATRSEDSSDSWTENDNASNNSTEASTSSVKSCEEPSSTVPKKKTSKKLQFQEELSERILHLAEKEDDQVDLELSTIWQHMKRKLNNDKIDDLLDKTRLRTVPGSFLIINVEGLKLQP